MGPAHDSSVMVLVSPAYKTPQQPTAFLHDLSLSLLSYIILCSPASDSPTKTLLRYRTAKEQRGMQEGCIGSQTWNSLEGRAFLLFLLLPTSFIGKQTDLYSCFFHLQVM